MLPRVSRSAGYIQDGLSKDQALDQLSRILSSQTFSRSKRLGRFLSFTVEQSLEGNQSEIKEYLVGVEVFNRLETFDPRIDSIVRVEARRLRSKMEKYYTTEGKNDPLVIEFQRGSYVPSIGTREQMWSNGMRGSCGPKRNVAIRPLANLSTDPIHDRFCEGLAQHLVSSLMKVPGVVLFAAPHDVVLDYRLEGNIRRQEDGVRVTIQLIETDSGTYVWSEGYERDVRDTFGLEDEIGHSLQTAMLAIA